MRTGRLEAPGRRSRRSTGTWMKRAPEPTVSLHKRLIDHTRRQPDREDGTRDQVRVLSAAPSSNKERG